MISDWPERLGATSVRGDLADLISKVDGAPARHQIVAWLDQLTDVEVMERVRRLGVTFNYDPEVVLRNVDILNGLRDEALAFGREAQPAV